MREFDTKRNMMPSRNGSKGSRGNMTQSDLGKNKAYDSLYEKGKEKLLNADKRKILNEKRELKKIKDSRFKNEKSKQIRIEGFVKEFRFKLGKILQAANQENIVQPLNTMDFALSSNETVGIMQEMGFIPDHLTRDYDE